MYNILASRKVVGSKFLAGSVKLSRSNYESFTNILNSPKKYYTVFISQKGIFFSLILIVLFINILH